MNLIQFTGGSGLGPTQTKAFASNVTANSTLLCVVRDGSESNDPLLAVSDNVNGSWLKDGSHNLTVDGDSTAVFRLPKAAAGATTVSVAVTGSGSCEFSIFEYAIDPSGGVLDQSAIGYNAASGTAASGNTGTTTAANELCFSAVVTTNGSSPYAAVSPYTTEETGSNNSGYVGSGQDIVSSTGVQSASFTLGGSDEWVCYCLTYKAGSVSIPNLLGQACL